MKLYKEFTQTDYDKIAKDVITFSKKNESELFSTLGHALNDLGIEASDEPEVLFKRIDAGATGISATKGFNFISKTKPLLKGQAEKKGRGFWKKFAKKIQKTICENQSIIDIINGNASLKDKLAVAIPAILSTIGGGIVLGPIYLTLVCIALSIIIKAGLKTYCEV